MRITSQEKISQWNQILLECENSRITIADFCKQKNLSPSCFYKWKQRLTTSDVIGNNKPNTTLFDITERVVKLKEPDQNASQISKEQTRPLCEITLPNKVTIKVDGKISCTNLETLLKVVSQC